MTNQLAQKYNSIKLIYKMREALKEVKYLKDGVFSRFEEYYTNKTILVLHSLMQNEQVKEKENIILSLATLQKEKFYLTTLKSLMTNWNHQEIKKARLDLMESTYQTVGQVIYPLANGVFNAISIKKLQDKEYVDSILENVDLNEVNEDTWLMLFASHHLIKDGKFKDAKYLIVHLISYIALQEANLYKSSQYKISNKKLLEQLLTNLQLDLDKEENLKEIYHTLLAWSRKFGFQFREGHYEELKFFINFSYEIKDKPFVKAVIVEKDNFSYDSHIRWEKVDALP